MKNLWLARIISLNVETGFQLIGLVSNLQNSFPVSEILGIIPFSIFVVSLVLKMRYKALILFFIFYFFLQCEARDFEECRKGNHNPS